MRSLRIIVIPPSFCPRENIYLKNLKTFFRIGLLSKKKNPFSSSPRQVFFAFWKMKQNKKQKAHKFLSYKFFLHGFLLSSKILLNEKFRYAKSRMGMRSKKSR